MTTYTREEFEEAIRSHLSTISKCEKSYPKLKPGSAQQTLLARRIKALHMSVELMRRELEEIARQ